MATNLRGHHVVEPGRTAEYDRIFQTHPFGTMVAGVALWIVGTLTAIIAGQTGGVLVTLLLLSLGAGAAIVVAGARLGIRNAKRLEVITRNLEALRHVFVFDEDAAIDEAVWGAAGIAAEYEALEEDTVRLERAAVRTADQDAELDRRRAELRRLAEQIQDLLTVEA